MLCRVNTRLIENSSQHLSMIDPNSEVVEAECAQGITGSGHQFGFNNHRARAQHIDVALIKLAQASTGESIGAPYRLNLIPLEKLWQLILVLCDDARQRDRQVVAQREIGLTS